MNELQDSRNENSSQSIRVSPRHLGQMGRPDFCPACFSVSIGLGFRPPFDMPMPGLMHNLDRFEKLLVQAQFKAKGVAPKWLSSLGCSEPVEFPYKMTREFPKYGLTLVGMPDEVFCDSDGSLILVDYKSAKYKGDEDPFMSCYRTQLLGYTILLEHHRIGTVKKAALIYFENILADYKEKPLDLLTNDGMRVPFTVKIHEVEIDRKALDPMLKAFRAYADAATLPEGRKGCKTCERLKVLFDIERSFHSSEKIIDGLRNQDASTIYEHLALADAKRREARARESHGWEDYLTSGLSDEADSIPSAFDL